MNIYGEIYRLAHIYSEAHRGELADSIYLGDEVYCSLLAETRDFQFAAGAPRHETVMGLRIYRVSNDPQHMRVDKLG